MAKWTPPTDPTAVKELFDEYVFTFIEGDIKREIWLAKKTEHDKIAGVYPGTYPGGGNLLAALGLVCYTEFLGAFIKPEGEPGERYRAFFESMGQPYQEFLKTQIDPGVYDLYRNGLAHEYAVKRNCKVAMLKGPEACGVGRMPDGRYFFVVERYFEDLQKAARKLYEKLTGASPPPL